MEDESLNFYDSPYCDVIWRILLLQYSFQDGVYDMSELYYIFKVMTASVIKHIAHVGYFIKVISKHYTYSYHIIHTVKCQNEERKTNDVTKMISKTNPKTLLPQRF